ncbi:MAG: efflux pump rane transporter BepE [Verrucomicrobiota bacterium]|jgi:hydrophobe/amphiphile efflux-1 (HAE1) family protein
MGWDFFIRRPIFSAVLSLIIVLIGGLALLNLPLSQYPQIAPPTVTVVASYPGASPEALVNNVAAPLEEQINGVEGLLYYSSNASSSGALSITVTFENGVDPDMATILVANRVKLAEPRLPEEVRRLGVITKKRSNDILMSVSVVSPQATRDSVFLSNYASSTIVEEIKRLPGVGDAGVFGARDYAMRVWLRPDRMAALGVTSAEVVRAIRATNTQYAVGRLGQEPAVDAAFVVPVVARGRLATPEQFGAIVLRADAGRGVLRLRDVARVELGSQSYEQLSMLDGKPVAGIRVFLQTGANALETADRIRARMDELARQFPPDVEYAIPFDTTRFVRSAIGEVRGTLVEAALLVAAVVFLFLGSWRATLIPMIAVPVSLIGACAGLWVMGYGINILTLFAMVIAIGIVVDDAIVVLENTERLMREKGMGAFDAARESVREVAGAIVAIVCVLVCVFLPVAFLGGIAGVLYRQFAVTVALSVILSGFVALTLTPTLCALLLRPHAPAAGGPARRLLEGFGRGFGAVASWHGRLVRWLLDHPRSAATGFLAIVLANVALVATIPRGFLPPEDQGYLLAMVALPDGAGIERTKAFMDDLTPKLRADPSVRHTFAISGFDLLGGGERTNSGTIFLPLKDFGTRPPGGEALARQLNGIGMTQPDGMCLIVNPPAIRGIGTAGGFEFYLQAKEDDDPARLAANIEKLESALRARPELTGIRVFLRPSVPQFLAEVDEVRAASLGVLLPELHEALQATIGVVYANDFTLAGRTYRVLVQSEAADRMDAAAAGRVSVRAASGEMVPLSSFVRFKPWSGPEQLERHMGFLSARLICSPAPGVSSGDAIALVERIAEDLMPVGYGIDWTAQALQEKRAATSALPAFLLALLMVFLILAALYEDLALPLGVLLTVPFALLGALLAIFARGMPNDIYFQIGLVTLIGLAAKNAILIVEFAESARRAGRSAAEAAVEAARMRLRPLVMTSMAFVLGVVPLAFAGGAGAAARQSMGTGVLGGMLLDTFVATLFIPWFFHLLSGRKERAARA